MICDRRQWGSAADPVGKLDAGPKVDTAFRWFAVVQRVGATCYIILPIASSSSPETISPSSQAYPLPLNARAIERSNGMRLSSSVRKRLIRLCLRKLLSMTSRTRCSYSSFPKAPWLDLTFATLSQNSAYMSSLWRTSMPRPECITRKRQRVPAIASTIGASASCPV